jgi:hypothetical protein
MTELLIERFAFVLGFITLTLSVGLLLLMAAREVFDVDQRRKEVNDPASGKTWTWEWRLMSDFAQNARTELALLSKDFVFAVRLMLVVVVLLYGVELVVRGLGYFASTGWLGVWLGKWCTLIRNFWEQNSELDSLVRYGLATVVVLVAPILLGRAVLVVQNVIRAKEDQMGNKDPWWT